MKLTRTAAAFCACLLSACGEVIVYETDGNQTISARSFSTSGTRQ